MSRAMGLVPGMNTVQLALETDPRLAAETITGKLCEDDENTERLAIMMDIEHEASKAAILAEGDDTFADIPWLEFLRVIEEEGFILESLLPYEFQGATLKHLVAVHPEGALIIATSWKTVHDGEIVDRVNSAKMYYNIGNADAPTSGYVRVHEGFRYHLNRLRQVAPFVSPWRVNPGVDVKSHKNVPAAYELMKDAV